MDRPKESDWKTFRKRVPEWRERYLEQQNRQLADMLCDGQQTPTENFWATKERMKKTARILVDCLDGHSRSRMEMYLLQMYKYEMIGDADLDEFSAELKGRILGMFEVYKM